MTVLSGIDFFEQNFTKVNKILQKLTKFYKNWQMLQKLTNVTKIDKILQKLTKFYKNWQNFTMADDVKW